MTVSVQVSHSWNIETIINSEIQFNISLNYVKLLEQDHYALKLILYTGCV